MLRAEQVRVRCKVLNMPLPSMPQAPLQQGSHLQALIRNAAGNTQVQVCAIWGYYLLRSLQLLFFMLLKYWF